MTAVSKGSGCSFRGVGAAFAENVAELGLLDCGAGDEENLELMLVIHDAFRPNDGRLWGLRSRGLCGNGCDG